jgi:hypothetical protein
MILCGAKLRPPKTRSRIRAVWVQLEGALIFDDRPVVILPIFGFLPGAQRGGGGAPGKTHSED